MFLFTSVLAHPAAALAEPSIQENRTQAKSLQKEIDQLAPKVEVAVEQYNQAFIRLSTVRGNLQESTLKLEEAKKNLIINQSRLNRRVAGIYKSGQGLGVLDLVFSSQSMGDFLLAINSVQVVSEHDAGLVKQVKHDRVEIIRTKKKLAAQENTQKAEAEFLRSKKVEIEGGLAKQQSALTKINSKIKSREKADELARMAQARTSARLNTPVAGARTRTGSPQIVAAPAAAPGPRAAQVVSIAMAQLGKPYVWAAAGPNSFDCSGLTMYVFAQVGVGLPHSAEAQYNMGSRVSRDQLQPGDLIFGADGGYIGHVGIYIGNDQYITAPQTGDVVKISNVSARSNYAGAVRLL